MSSHSNSEIPRSKDEGTDGVPDRSSKGFGKSTLLLALCWTVYTCSYIGKLSYVANINQIETAFDVSHSQAGMVSTFFFFAYGIGQIINGIFCKKYNIKYVVFASLCVGSLMNIAVAFAPKFYLLKYFWLINGIAMSFMWSILIRLLSETLKKKDIDKAIIVMGTTVATGSFLIYGISALFAAVATYKVTFCVSAGLVLLIGVIWLFSYNSLIIPLKKESESESAIIENEKSPAVVSSGNMKKYITVIVAILAFFAVVNNFVKDGLTAWTPDILSTIYLTPGWLSILLTLLLPLLAIPGTVAAVKIHKIAKNFVSTCVIMFIMSGVLTGIVIGFLSTAGIAVTITCFSLISCLMSGIDNVIVSMLPLQMKDKINSGKIAGILNGFCYLGSTLSSYGLGFVADKWGWYSVFGVLLGAMAIAILVGFAYLFLNKKAAR